MTRAAPRFPLEHKKGTRRRYDLLLFLEDETVSLLNPREDHQNSGRDESMVRSDETRRRPPLNFDAVQVLHP